MAGMGRFQGLIGIGLILGLAFLFSNNRRHINYRIVFSGLLLQMVIAVLVLKVPPITKIFQFLGHGMEKVELFAFRGASFVYDGVAIQKVDGTIANYAAGGFVFAFNVTATIILVCAVVAVFYHLGIMQRVVSVIAKAMNVIMG